MLRGGGGEPNRGKGWRYLPAVELRGVTCLALGKSVIRVWLDVPIFAWQSGKYEHKTDPTPLSPRPWTWWLKFVSCLRCLANCHDQLRNLSQNNHDQISRNYCFDKGKPSQFSKWAPLVAVTQAWWPMDKLHLRWQAFARWKHPSQSESESASQESSAPKEIDYIVCACWRKKAKWVNFLGCGKSIDQCKSL